METKELARLAKKISSEKRFILDWSYPIKKRTLCSICGRTLDNGNFVRMWFEVGRNVYTNYIAQKGIKGYTICHQHPKEQIIENARSVFDSATKRDAVLESGVHIVFRNERISQHLDLFKFIEDDVEFSDFRDFVKNANSRYFEDSKSTEKMITVNNRFVVEFENDLNDLINRRRLAGFADKNYKAGMEACRDKLNKEMGTRVGMSYRTGPCIDSLERSLVDYIQHLAVTRFIHNKEVPFSDFAQKRIARYVLKWQGEKCLRNSDRKDRRIKAAMLIELDRIESAVKICRNQ